MTKILPARFVLFVVVLIVGTGAALWLLPPLHGIMTGFDLAAFVFLASCLPLLEPAPR
jgi:hypothetical protein